MDSRTASYLAHLAQAAYEPATSCALDCQPLGLSVTCLDDTTTQCFVGFAADHQVVSFRGTDVEEVHDWVIDGKVLRELWGAKKAGRGGVHRGFDEALQLVYDQVLPVLQPKLPIYVVGHSLGGALATLFAARITLQRPDMLLAGGLTLGSPGSVTRPLPNGSPRSSAADGAGR